MKEEYVKQGRVLAEDQPHRHAANSAQNLALRVTFSFLTALSLREKLLKISA